MILATENLSKEAIAFYSDNNYTKTLETILKIEENNRTALDWLILGNLLDEKDQKQEALFMYQKAINLDSKFYKAYYNIGNIYLEQEKNNMAVEAYEKALKINKESPYLYYNLSCAYIKLGKIKQAKSCLLKAVTLNNNIADIHYNLAYVYKSLNKHKTAQIYLDNYNKLVDSL